MSAPVRTEAGDGVLVVTIDRPEVRNAVDRATAEAIGAAMAELDTRRDCSVGVITGAGGTFSSGMDLKAFARGEMPVTPERGFAGLVRRPPAKPLIAAVEGHALAGGMEIALACDLVVASADAVFGVPEVKRGLTANGGALLRLPQRLPYQVAMELILTGDSLSAARAHELGLVNTLARPGEVLEAAVALARRIAANGPLALAVSKRVVVESQDWTRDEAFDRQEELVAPVRNSTDAQEGVRAFAEKRSPVWKGA